MQKALYLKAIIYKETEKMGRPADLTKQDLIDLGIKNITEAGEIETEKDVNYSIQLTTRESRFQKKTYRLLCIYSNKIYKDRRKANPKATSGTKMIVLSRAIWAWHKGYCPANMDIDHINDDSLDDRLSNYQLLTRKQNLAKRRGHMNQYERSYKK